MTKDSIHLEMRRMRSAGAWPRLREGKGRQIDTLG